MPEATISKQTLTMAQKTKFNMLSIEKVHNFVNIISSSSSITQDFKELRQSVGEDKALVKFYRIFQPAETILCIQNLKSSKFLKTAITQISKKVQKYANEIYNKTAFIAAILDSRIKLELIFANMNTEANRTIFNNIFKTEYAELVLNNSSTSLTFTSFIFFTSSTSFISSTLFTSSTNLK
ncbi:2391_t:CDS:2, partial [Dentiscutata heterogama]